LLKNPLIILLYWLGFGLKTGGMDMLIYKLIYILICSIMDFRAVFRVLRGYIGVFGGYIWRFWAQFFLQVVFDF